MDHCIIIIIYKINNLHGGELSTLTRYFKKAAKMKIQKIDEVNDVEKNYVTVVGMTMVAILKIDGCGW